jgi:tRNA(Ile2) C34 agmatinyltransferase TiaS
MTVSGSTAPKCPKCNRKMTSFKKEDVEFRCSKCDVDPMEHSKGWLSSELKPPSR